PYEPPDGAGHREDTARIGSVTSTRPRDAQVLSCRPGSQVQSGSVVVEGAGRLPVVAPESRDEGPHLPVAAGVGDLGDRVICLQSRRAEGCPGFSRLSTRSSSTLSAGGAVHRILQLGP